MDLVFKALGNATRRQICDALRDCPMTTGQLAQVLSHLNRCTVMQHLKVLEQAGLVVVARKGSTWVLLHMTRGPDRSLVYQAVIEGARELD